VDKEQGARLGALLRERRLAAGLSTYELGERVHCKNSTIVRLEQGAFAAPSPDKLARIADALGMTLADIYAHAGYVIPEDLPGFHAYLLARYRDLPSEAIHELTELFDQLVARHTPVAVTEDAGELVDVTEGGRP
jgi:transcriptional regulator with XRE-family HTH domain